MTVQQQSPTASSRIIIIIMMSLLFCGVAIAAFLALEVAHLRFSLPLNLSLPWISSLSSPSSSPSSSSLDSRIIPLHRRQLLALSSSSSSSAATSNTNTTNNNNNHNNAKKTSSSSSSSSLPRFLYIITSGGQGRKNNEFDLRFKTKVQPIIVNSVKSLLHNQFCTVDVYLILSFDLDPPQEEALRNALPDGVGLELWTEATPYGISCKFNDKTSCMIQLDGHDKRYGPARLAKLQKGGAQLARQHRYVVKDKLPYYDFFLAFEDDMLIKQSHVQQHMKWMKQIRKMQLEAPNRRVESNDWRDPLTRYQLLRFRPGFIRVEALAKKHRPVEDQLILDIPTNISKNIHIDPKHCCLENDYYEEDDKQQQQQQQQLFDIQPEELMIWETTLFGQSVRTLEPLRSDQTTYDNNKTWVSLLALQPPHMAPAALWPGDLITPAPEYKRYQYANAKNLAQSAGWMASRREILELHTTLCKGGFLPPFDPPQFKNDGWINNVEFWSGGIQMWANQCSIQRFIPLQEFDKHLLYHSSNNKQIKMPKNRMIRARDMLGQLQVVQQMGEERIDWK